MIKKTQNCEYSKNEYSQYWVFWFIFSSYEFFKERSNCLLLPDSLWCPIQELGSFFNVDWYSSITHNFVVFVHFFKLTHICALSVKEWNSVAKGKHLEQHECLTTSSRYSHTLRKESTISAIPHFTLKEQLLTVCLFLWRIGGSILMVQYEVSLWAC